MGWWAAGSELAHCLFGAERYDSGEILFKGAPFAPKTPRHAVEAGIALLTEDRKKSGLVLTTTIRDNASLAAFPKLSRAGFIDRARQEQSIREKVDELKIQPRDIDRLVNHLSGGNQQKVIFAKWLLVNADLIILDEPTRGIDVATKVEIYQIMHRLTQQGIGFLLISSEMLEILGMSDRILVMRQGRLVGVGPGRSDRRKAGAGDGRTARAKRDERSARAVCKSLRSPMM